jgi:transcriptional regulator with XRE-family HTH domain
MAVSKQVVRRGRPSGSRSTDPKVAAALGRAIASLRIAAGLSQEALALAANVGRSNISAIETGRTVPNFVGVVRIAAALNCSLSTVMQEFEDHYAVGKEP